MVGSVAPFPFPTRPPLTKETTTQMKTKLVIVQRPREAGYFVELTKGAERMEIVRTETHQDALLAARGISSWTGLKIYDKA